MNLSRLKIFVVTFCLVVFSTECFPAVGADRNSEGQSGAGRAPLRLQKAANGGLMVSTTPFIPSSGTLVSINGIPLRGRSEREINQLLEGAIGESIEICYLDGNEALCTKRFPIEPRKRVNSFGETDWNRPFDNLDLSSPGWFERADQFVDKNLDLFARAASCRGVRGVSDLPGETAAAIGQKSAEAVVLNDGVGSWTGADKYLKVLLKDAHFDPRFADSMPSVAEDLIEDLIALGRLKEADSLCKQWMEKLQKSPKSNQDVTSLNGVSLLYAKVLSAEGRKQEAHAIASTLCDQAEAARLPFIYGAQSEDLANLLKELGDLDRASRIYETFLSIDSSAKLLPNQHVRLANVRRYCFYTYKLAEVQQKQGLIDAAIASLNRALEFYDQRLLSDIRLVPEKMCMFFPTRSDIELRLSEFELQKGDPAAAKTSILSAINEIETALGKRSAVLRQPLTVLASTLEQLHESREEEVVIDRTKTIEPTQQSEMSNSQLLTLLNQASVAKSNDLSDVISKLLFVYEGTRPASETQHHELNLFCQLVQLARSLSDRSLFYQSNALLDELSKVAPPIECTPSAYCVIAVEKAINAERMKLKADVWSDVLRDIPIEARPVSAPDPSGVSIMTAERFRELAVLYSAAGENSRALMLVDKGLSALAKSESGLGHDGSQRDAWAVEKAVLLLDAAIIRTQSGQLVEGRRLSAEAIAAYPAKEGGSPAEIDRFRERFATKILQLATADKDKQSRENAKRLLQLVLAKMPVNMSSQNRLGLNASASEEKDPTRSSLEFRMAQLQFVDGNVDAAATHIKPAIHDCADNSSVDIYYLGADIAFAKADFRTAADFYSKAADGSQLIMLNTWERPFRRTCLRKAIECAEKCPSFNKTELANLYLLLGVEKEGLISDAPECLSLLEKAYAIIPDSDPGKDRLVSRIHMLKDSIELEQNRSRASQLQAAQGSPAKETPEQLHAREVQTGLSQIESAKQMAESQEKRDPSFASDKWIRLAWSEVQAERPQDARDHVLHGLRLYKRHGDTWDFPDPLLDSQPCIMLAAQGHGDYAEELLAQALRTVQSSFGEKSAAAAVQLSQTVRFRFENREEGAGFKTLSTLLKFDPRVLDVRAYRGQSAHVHLNDLITLLRNRKQEEVALKILREILSSEQASLDPDDSRIAATLLSIGETELSMGRNAQAAEDLLASARIFKLYVGNLRTESATRGLLTKAWEALGRQDVDAIEVRPIGWVSPALLRALGDSEVARKIEINQRMPANYVDPSYPMENGRFIYDRKEDSVKQIEDLQAEYKDACVEAPYSTRAVNALDHLMEVALSEQNWQVLADASVSRCKIYERGSDELAGRTVGCVIPNAQRMDYYHRAARAFIHLNRIDEAEKWLDRADRMLPEKNCFEYITLATLELQCNNNSLAAKYAELGDSVFTDQYFAVYPAAAANVWKKLGKPDRADAIIAKGKHVWDKDQQQLQEIKNSAFKQTGI